MSKESVSTQEIQDAVFARIMSQQYRPGERLPSVRELAKELGANRNTVNRAYQMLVDLSIIRPAAQGRKGFIVKPLSASTSSRAALQHHFYSQARQVIWQGFASGLSPEEASEQLNHALKDVYQLGNLIIAFFECNVQDSEHMGGYLRQMLQREVYCGLLSELNDETAAKYDLVITTFHHLSAVMQSLKKHSDKVVGIDTRLSPDTLLEIARLPNGSLGIVCTLGSTAQMLQHLLFSYYPDREIRAVTIDDTAAVRQLCHQCDYVLVTRTCTQELKKLSKRLPDMVLHFQIDQQSGQFLAQRVHTLQLEKTRELRAVTHPDMLQAQQVN
jgi:GntR family transcriptional regulator